MAKQELDLIGRASLPGLLRWSWSVYGAAIRHSLEQARFDDLPRNGPYVLSALARTGEPLSDVVRQLAVTKQAAGQLVDSLVLRGYLQRETDPGDRRRLVVSLTVRGAAAAEVVRGAVEEVDLALEKRVGAESIARTRQTLGALIAMAAHDA